MTAEEADKLLDELFAYHGCPIFDEHRHIMRRIVQRHSKRYARRYAGWLFEG